MACVYEEFGENRAGWVGLGALWSESGQLLITITSVGVAPTLDGTDQGSGILSVLVPQ